METSISEKVDSPSVRINESSEESTWDPFEWIQQLTAFRKKYRVELELDEASEKDLAELKAQAVALNAKPTKVKRFAKLLRKRSVAMREHSVELRERSEKLVLLAQALKEIVPTAAAVGGEK